MHIRNKSFDFLDVLILPGGLTPIGQPLSKVINKGYKGHFCDMYDQYILTAEIHNGAPRLPSWQLLATWVVKAWDMILPELVRKLCTACGHLLREELAGDNVTNIVVAKNNEFATKVDRLYGPEARAHFDDVEN